jgi:hypothetical protein
MVLSTTLAAVLNSLALQGDAVEILVINKNGTRRDILELKKD